MKQGKNKRNNTQNLKRIYTAACTDRHQRTDGYSVSAGVSGSAAGFWGLKRADEDKSVRIVTTDLNISANRAA